LNVIETGEMHIASKLTFPVCKPIHQMIWNHCSYGGNMEVRAYEKYNWVTSLRSL